MHVPMLKVEVAVPKRKWRHLLDTLMEWGFLHPEEYTGEHRFDLTEEEEEERRKARRILGLIGEVESYVGEIKEFPSEGEMDHEGVLRVRNEILQVQREITSLEEEMKRLRDYLELSEVLKGGEVGVVLNRNELGAKALLSRILQREGYSYSERIVGEKFVITVEVPEGERERLESTLEGEGFILVKPPKGYSNLSEVREAVSVRIPRRLEGLRETLSQLRDRYERFLGAQKFLARYIFDLFRLKEKNLATSGFLVFLKGWIPRERLQEFKESLRKVDPNAVVRHGSPSEEEYENVPVALKNSPPLSWFQSLLDIYVPPVYGTFDPTIIIAVFFPIYYGFMLGDAGYGLVGMFLFWTLARITRPGSAAHNISMVYFINSAMALFFGLLFGEIFGDWGIKVGLIEPLFHRTHHGMDLLLIAIGFGFFQILISMLIGVWNNWVLKHLEHSLFELGRFFAVLGILFLLPLGLSFMGIERPWLEGVSHLSGPLAITGGLFAVIGVLLVFVAEWMTGGIIKGLIGLIEIFSAFGNVLSYARLAAVGLASAILAEIANHFAHIIPIPLFAITVVVAFHLLAFTLGIVDPTIQGVRLQFVESFTKFFLPASRIFKPIRKGGEA